MTNNDLNNYNELIFNPDEYIDILPNQDNIIHLDINILKAFPEHKFKLYEGERLDDMVKSIKEYGILMPLIVWLKDDEYIILSGHNRHNAARLVGLKTVPCIVKKGLEEDEATLIVTETNLIQRGFSDLSYSERAFVLSQHYSAIRNQGKRSDILDELEKIENTFNTSNNNDDATSCPVGTKLRTDEKISQKYDLSARNVSRYIKLTELIPALLQMLDNDELAFRSAYALAFISKDIQELLFEIISENNIKLSMKKSEELKMAFSKKKLKDKEDILEILTDKKRMNVKKQNTSFKLSSNLVNRYFQDTNKKDMISTIEKAVEFYFKFENMQNYNENMREEKEKENSVHVNQINMDELEKTENTFNTSDSNDDATSSQLETKLRTDEKPTQEKNNDKTEKDEEFEEWQKQIEAFKKQFIYEG